MNGRVLHFAFGPVQGFVAQARRTRDLWAGSYLLSYLAGSAIRALEMVCGDEAGERTVIFPAVYSDPLMRVLRNVATSEERQFAARVGSLPNRFKASIPDSVNGDVCSSAIRVRWTEIAGVVRDRVNLPSESVWNRQIAATWEFFWVVGEDADLDARKNLRSHLPPDEKGEKCTICGERQELSGHQGGNRGEIDAWWSKHIRPNLAKLDLGGRERLCAPCLVKRVFPRVAEKAIGWAVDRSFPSTSYMAAVGWIVRTLNAAAENKEASEALRDFVGTTGRLKVPRAESATRIAGIEVAAAASGIERNASEFTGLDGTVFFRDGVANRQEFMPELNPEDRDLLLTELRELQKAVGTSANPFYALLLMDGDGMGRILSHHHNKQTLVTAALADFNAGVVDAVRSHDGRLIYAGGDDVLALLTVEQALDCAVACRTAYVEAFTQHAPFVVKAAATISAAIEYAHMQTPLSVVVRDAHRLLERVAKDGTGRDAVACRVWKRGGPVLTWSLPWTKMLRDEAGGTPTLVAEIQRRFEGGSAEPAQFSSKFFYKLRGLFEMLDSGGETIKRVMTAEYLAGRDVRWPKDWSEEQRRVEAEARVAGLLSLCRQQTRRVSNGVEDFEDGPLHDDGALLVRFLAQKDI